MFDRLFTIQVAPHRVTDISLFVDCEIIQGHISAQNPIKYLLLLQTSLAVRMAGIRQLRSDNLLTLLLFNIFLFFQHCSKFFMEVCLNDLTGLFGERVKLEGLQEFFEREHFNFFLFLAFFGNIIT